MERITTRLGLLEGLKALHAVEELARQNYIQDLEDYQEPELLAVLSHIKAEEDKHIELLLELIEMLSAKD
jgi:rubrerythrin